MCWIKISDHKPDNKQKCEVQTWVQLELFADEETCINNSTHFVIYNETKDAFIECGTKKKIENVKYWKPIQE